MSLIRDDVDWIVMKCLEKDRTRRYETANGLARDVARFLKDEPVEASPPSATYRMRKFARKYRKPLRVVVAVALILVGASVFSVWQAARATRAEREQRRLAESESLHRAEAEEQRTLATVAAAKERDAAKQAQQARDSAVGAKREAILRLADNYTARARGRQLAVERSLGPLVCQCRDHLA